MTDELRDAIRYFQEDNGLKVTGELDEKTCAWLRAHHECDETPEEEEDDPGEEDGDDEAEDDDNAESTGAARSEEPPG
jgi:hypothetical protein